MAATTRFCAVLCCTLTPSQTDRIVSVRSSPRKLNCGQRSGRGWYRVASFIRRSRPAPYCNCRKNDHEGSRGEGYGGWIPETLIRPRSFPIVKMVRQIADYEKGENGIDANKKTHVAANPCALECG